MKNLCEPNPCRNNAICNVKQINYQSTLECLCPESFYGDYCDKGKFKNCFHIFQRIYFNLYKKYLVRETCKTHPCLNGGKCSQINMTHTQCECPYGFQGYRCEYGNELENFLIKSEKYFKTPTKTKKMWMNAW